MVFWNDYIIPLASTNSTENMHVTFLCTKNFGPLVRNISPTPPLHMAKCKGGVTAEAKTNHFSNNEFRSKYRVPLVIFKRCEIQFSVEKNVVVPNFLLKSHNFSKNNGSLIDIWNLTCGAQLGRSQFVISEDFQIWCLFR